MKSIRIDDDKSSKNRIAFQITGDSSESFRKMFEESLRPRLDLQELNPSLQGSILYIDNVSHTPGIADAFDTLVKQAQDAVKHAGGVEKEKEKIDADAKNESLKRFKKSQGIPE